MPFVDVSFNKLVPLQFSHLTLMSFCTQGLPGVAESTFQKAKENLLHGEKVPVRADEEW